MPGIELAGLACHPLPALTRRVRSRGLTQQLPVAIQHRITADHNAIGANLRIKYMCDSIRLRSGQRRRHIAWRRQWIEIRDDGVLVHPGDDDQRIDSRLAQHLTTAW